MKYNSIKFCNNINYLCEKKKITKAELEDAIGVSRGYLSRLNSKERVPGVDKVEEIAEYFKVSIDYLLHGDFNDESEIDNVVLLQHLVEKMIIDTDKGAIIWHQGAGAESRLLNLKTAGVNLEDTIFTEEDAERGAEFIELEGKYCYITYKGVIENRDFFLLVQVEVLDKKGWLLYVFKKRTTDYDELGDDVCEEEYSKKIFNTLDCHDGKLDEVIEKLLQRIKKRIEDIYLDWEAKEWINDYLNNQ